jgi:hypothetical protein
VANDTLPALRSANSNKTLEQIFISLTNS